MYIYIFKELGNNRNLKTVSGLTESTDLIVQNLKLNAISGETVPLRTFKHALQVIRMIK
jgi:hypothetical protein